MKKVILFEQFISEAANIKDTAKNILDGLDSTAQLHVDYVPKEALSTIESSLKKNKSLSGKDAAKAAKEIRMNLEEIGILSNTFSPVDVEIIIMKHLNESKVNETFIGPFVFSDKSSDDELKDIYNSALDGYANWKKGLQYPKGDYKKAYQEVEKILKKRGVKVDESLNEAKDASREEIMDLMETKYKIKHVRTSEEFMRGDEGGIWIAGDNGEELSGNKIFDYYNGSAKYKNGVLKNVVDTVEKRGWWFSWNDPGTMMIWPKN